ncbi:MAG: acetate/propionate family kinase [Candidatus Saccharimonadaceae bacterium]
MFLLSINAGSSSLKVSIFDESRLKTPSASVSVEGIGTPDATLIPGGTYGSDAVERLTINDFNEAAEQIKIWLSENLSIQGDDIKAIGYRIVHGGERYKTASLITPDLINYLESITALAPNHMPASLTAMRAFVEAYPNAAQVACFDTSFFHDVPDLAKTLPIPLTLQRENNIRRYGFHGLSYEYLLTNFKSYEGEHAANGRIIMAHLGSGASIAACKDGAPVDMSMGFTPVSGIMMSTRSGDLEPGLLSYLEKEKGMSTDEISELVTHKSGLLGVSGVTSDMQILLKTQHDNPDVALAVDLFCYKITKTIGSYIAALGGVDSIIFSGGIGERSAEVRARILKNFGFVGLELEETRNSANERLISTDSSKVGVHVIPASEDYSIITQTLNAIGSNE